jgi:hypothetical protein
VYRFEQEDWKTGRKINDLLVFPSSCEFFEPIDTPADGCGRFRRWTRFLRRETLPGRPDRTGGATLSTVQRTRRAAEIIGFIAALAASCALPAYQVEGRGESSAAGTGGLGASGSEASSSGSQGGRGGADGVDGGGDPDGDGGKGDAAVCNLDFIQCENLSAEGQPCFCKSSICFIDKCELTGAGEAHALACKPDPNNPDKLIWTRLPEALQCCPQNKRPCRTDLKEVCVDTKKPAGVACVKNPCETLPMLDCMGCASALCVDPSTVCTLNGSIVVCSPPP